MRLVQDYYRLKPLIIIDETQNDKYTFQKVKLLLLTILLLYYRYAAVHLINLSQYLFCKKLFKHVKTLSWLY